MTVNRTNPDQYQLRFPAGLRDRVKAIADHNGRSMNAEIIAMIESAQDGGSAEAARFKALLDEERQASSRALKMVDQQMDMLLDYRDIVRRANGQIVQQAKIIESICYIVTSLEAAPDDDVLALVERMLTAAKAVQADHEPADVKEAREELRKLDKAIEKADDLLKKP
ncbi:Arc family DNA-binding protein [Rhizobium ruizarguesonis]|uniref:Arc family DNA-binding protein n=1 Tax=Rhizobium ruizarguesonis TaxID=2081791 RepID=UPI001030E0A6|nr:Arc family DNA-binding protein [Rhizobium ruizarguesonis]TAV08390.1 Arc family DNA-binding protein [Rhizobium ruizarguesonis]